MISILDLKYKSVEWYPSDQLNYNKSNVNELQEFELSFDVDFNFSQTQQQQIFIQDLQKLKFTTFDTWEELGWAVGDSITFNYSAGGVLQSFSAAITSISGDTLQFDTPLTGVSAGSTFPDNSVPIGYLSITNAKTFEYLDFSFNQLLENSAFSLASLIDGTQQRFTISGVETVLVANVGTYYNFTQQKPKSGGYMNSVQMKKNAGTGFTIKGQFVTPYVFTDFQTDYNSGENFKELFYIKVRPTVSPSPYLEKTQEKEGFSGWLDENFDGLPNNFTSSIQWYDSNDQPISQLDYGQKCKAVVNILHNSEGVIEDKFVINFWHKPEQALYSNNKYSFFENVMMNRALVDTTTSSLTDFTSFTFNTDKTSIIDGVSVTSIGLSEYELEFFVEYDAESKAYFDGINASDRNYVLTVHTQVDGLDVNNAERVNLEIDRDILQKELPQGGEFSRVDSQSLLDIKGDVIANFEVYTEDTVQYRQSFKSNLDPAFDENVQSVSVKTIAINTVTGDKFDLENFDFIFDNQSIDGTFQLTNTSSILDRNDYRTFPTSDYQQVRIQRNALGDTGDLRAYNLTYSLQNLWRYWKALQSAVGFGFNTSDPSTEYGENQNWEHYQVGDWEINIEVVYNALSLQYYKRLPFNINDYEETITGADTVTSDIVLLDENGLVVSNLIAGQVMTVRAIHTLTALNWDLETLWSENTYEPKEGQPRPMLVSFAQGYADTAQKGLGVNDYKVTNILNASNILYAETLIDVDKLPSGETSFTSKVKQIAEGYEQRVKKTFKKIQLPTSGFTEQDRGLNECCEKPFEVRADLLDKSNYKNDVTSHWVKLYDVTDTAEIKVYKGGDSQNGTLVTTYGSQIILPNDPITFCYEIDWRLMLQNNGVGCYYVTISFVSSGSSGTRQFGYYNLESWSLEDSRDNIQVLVRGSYNFYIQEEDINFQDSGVVNHLRFQGVFGNPKDEDKVINLINSQRELIGASRNFTPVYDVNCEYRSYYLTRVFRHMMLNCQEFRMTDYRLYSHQYDLIDIPVVLKELVDGGFEYTDGRRASYRAKVEHKINNNRALFSGGDTIKIPSVINFVPSGGDCLPAGYTLKNSLGSILSTGEIASGANEDIIAPDAEITLNSSSFIDAPSGSITDIDLIDQDNLDVLPQDITGSNITVWVYWAAQLIKTGQITSSGTGSDGDVQAGRGTDFDTLPNGTLNPFGTNERFTDTVGGQTYANYIMLDWSQRDKTSVQAYAFDFHPGGLEIFNSDFNYTDALAQAAALTLDGFNDWRIWNNREARWLIKDVSNANGFNYPPFNYGFGIGSVVAWTSTEFNATTGMIMDFGGRVIERNLKTNLAFYIPTRRYNIANDLGFATFHTTDPSGNTHNLRIDTSNGEDWIIDWGDGTTSIQSSAATASHTYTGTFNGYIRVKPVSGDLSLVTRFETNTGYFDFDISAFKQFENLDLILVNGANFSIFGDIGNLPTKITFLYLEGNSMFITGDLSSVSYVNVRIYLAGNLMELTYTTTTWAKTPRFITLRLNVGFLATSAEVDNLVNDTANATLPPSGGGTYNLAFNNAPRTAASDASVTTLNGFGITVINN